MKYFEAWKRRSEKKYRVIYKRGPSTIALVFLGMALSTWGIFAALSSFPVGAYLYYTVRPATTKILAKALQETGEAISPVNSAVIQETKVPERDPSLPEGQYLSIPKIGVDTVIWEASSEGYEEALKKGVWRVPEFGQPGQAGKPIILAAHRFGYLEWTQAYRLKNSFYDLPKLTGGDQIAIVYNQHRYIYRVLRVTEGTKIEDYSSDLILYTCKFLVSPLRVFVYAEEIN